MKRPLALPAFALLLLALACHPESREHTLDVEFARQAFTSLALGDPAVGALIDWEEFRVEGVTVGAMVKGLPFGVGRESLKSTAIASFSASMRGAGWSPTQLTGWRYGETNGTRSTVSATTPSGRVVVFTVEHKGPEKTRELAGVDVGVTFKL